MHFYCKANEDTRSQRLPENPSLDSCRPTSFIEPLCSLSWSTQSELASPTGCFWRILSSSCLDSDKCTACVSSEAWGLCWIDGSSLFTATEFSWLVSTCRQGSSVEALATGRRESRQSGQVVWVVSQLSMQSMWNAWPQVGICWSLSSAW